MLALTECMSVQSPSKSNASKQKRPAFNIATFNARGLTKPHKLHQLAGDLAKRHIDICGLQETKISAISDELIDDYRII